VVAYDNDNKVVAEQVIRTAGQTYTLNLLPIETKLNLTEKICRLLRFFLDKKGNLCPKEIIYYF
jgi:hypothetical protein